MELVQAEFLRRLMVASRASEDDLIKAAQRVLYLAQSFDKVFPGLDNLKKTHFPQITALL